MGPNRKSLLPLTATGVVLSIAACKLLIQLYSGQQYGYFRDELYYLACSRHLAWGYVDQPPLIALIAWMVRSTIGDSLAAIHLLPALAGGFEIVLTALIARELGGKKVAQGLAALAALVAGGVLGIDSFFSMNAFEPLFWMGCAWIVIRIVKTGDQKLWIWFGVLAGLGLENKHSMLIFGGGIVLGLLLTPQRKVFASPWIWIAGAIAFLIFLPNLAVEYPASLSVHRASEKYSAQRSRCSSIASRVFRPGDPDHASAHFDDLARGAVVLFSQRNAFVRWGGRGSSRRRSSSR